MKLKGINPLERHVEKIVVGVFALVLLAIFAWQFVGNPNAVQVGQQTVSPEKAPDVVRDMARQVKGRLEAASAPPIPPQPSVLGAVKQGLEPGAPALTPPLRLAGVVGAAAAPIVTPGPGTDRASGAFALFEPPAPTSIIAVINESTIDPAVPIRTPEAAAYLPKDQPYDLRSVSVQATVDARQVRAALTQPASGQVIPSVWWQAKVEILDVELQRETLQPNGSWAELTTIKPFPGAPSLRDRLRDASTKPADLTSILERERNERQFIRRPPYWPTISGNPWITPSEADGAGTPSTPPAVQAATRKIKDRKERIERLRIQIQRIDGGRPGTPGPGDGRDGGAPPPPPPPPGGGGKPPGNAHHHPHDLFSPDALAGIYAQAETSSVGSRWADVFAQRGGDRPPQPPPGGTTDRNAARKADLQRQLKAAEEELAELMAEIARLGYDEKGNKIGAEIKSFSEPLNSVTESTTETITLWAHDPSAQPGRTYRYRVVAWYTNPFFGNGAALDDAQKSLASSAAVPSAASQWSPPVSIDPSVCYVVLSARESGLVGAGSAAIYSDAAATGELYEFYYGYWRRAELNMNPGDRVAATISLPPLERFDITLNAAGEPDFQSMKATPLPARRTVALEEYFVDAVPTGSGVEAVMRSHSQPGALFLHRPGSDRDDALRLRLSASAASAANASVLRPGSSRPGVPGAPGAPGTPGTPGSGSGREDRDGGAPPPPPPPGGGAPPRPGGKPPG